MSRLYTLPDKASFVKLPRGTPPEACRFIGHLFATDGQAVFSTRGALKDVDAAGFRLLEEGFEPDGQTNWVSAYAVTPHKALYVDDLEAPRFFQPRALADLRVLAPHYATDGVQVYWNGMKIAGAEPGSFRPLNADYSLDRGHAYFRSWRMVNADPNGLQILGDAAERNLHLAHDGTSLYFWEQPVLSLGAAVPELLRDDRRYVTGIRVGDRVWSTREFETIHRSMRAGAPRTVQFADAGSHTPLDDALFAGLEDELSLFLILCSHKTIQAMEAFTRGKKGEQALVRAIERLNDKLPVKLALITPTTISVTSDGLAVYRQYGPVVDMLGSVVAALKR